MSEAFSESSSDSPRTSPPPRALQISPLSAMVARKILAAGLFFAAAGEVSAFAPGATLNLRAAPRAAATPLGFKMQSNAEILAPLLEANKR